MEKEVIQVYADPALKRRVEEAAAKHNVTIAEYSLEAIEQKLAEEGLLEGTDENSLKTTVKNDDTLLEEMRQLREQILARRGGKPIQIDILEQLRSERDDELTDMR